MNRYYTEKAANQKFLGGPYAEMYFKFGLSCDRNYLKYFESNSDSESEILLKMTIIFERSYRNKNNFAWNSEMGTLSKIL